MPPTNTWTLTLTPLDAPETTLMDVAHEDALRIFRALLAGETAADVAARATPSEPLAA